MIRNTKQLHYDKIADKLKSNTLSNKDWWARLKTFIIPCTKSLFRLLKWTMTYTQMRLTRLIFWTFFQSQTVLNELDTALLNLPDNVFCFFNLHLNSIVLCSTRSRICIKKFGNGQSIRAERSWQSYSSTTIKWTFLTLLLSFQSVPTNRHFSCILQRSQCLSCQSNRRFVCCI